MTYPMNTRWDWGVDPFHELNRLHRQMNRLFADRGASRTEFPALSLTGDQEVATLTAAVPGFDEKSLSVTVSGDTVSLEGTRPEPADTKPESYHRRERSRGAFARHVQLPFEVESEKVSARFENGVLTVALPRKESTKPRKISISAGA